MTRLRTLLRLRARPILPWLAAALTCLALPSSARADETGKSGRVSQLRINTPGSVEHASYHGSITIKRPTTGQLIEYRWGGSTCPAHKLTDTQLDILVMAFAQRDRTMLSPHYITGEGAGNRCLVGFEIVAS